MASIREELEQEFREGKLDYIVEDLKRFLEEQRDNLQRLLTHDMSGLHVGITRVIRRRNFDERSRFDLAVRLLIKQARTINPARDIKGQLADIAREIWLEGERLGRACDRTDENRIAKEWNDRFGAKFRDWMLLRVLFVFDRHREAFEEYFKVRPEKPRETGSRKRGPRKTG